MRRVLHRRGHFGGHGDGHAFKIGHRPSSDSELSLMMMPCRVQNHPRRDALHDREGRPMGASASPRVLPCGDAALTVEFGSEIDPALNARVLALDALVSRGVPGVIETVPT